MVFQRDLRTTLLPFDLSQRSVSVLALVIAKSGISQSEVATALSIERSGMVNIVDTLEARGLLRRALAETDRRAYALQATDAGRALFANVTASINAHEANVLTPLSLDERSELHRLRTKLARSGQELVD